MRRALEAYIKCMETLLRTAPQRRSPSGLGLGFIRIVLFYDFTSSVKISDENLGVLLNSKHICAIVPQRKKALEIVWELFGCSKLGYFLKHGNYVPACEW